MAETNNLSARERARLAKIALAKKHAERDKLIDKSIASYFKAEDQAEAARKALAVADEARAEQVRALGDLGLADGDLAELLGIDEKALRALRRNNRGANSSESQDELPVNDDEASVSSN